MLRTLKLILLFTLLCWISIVECTSCNVKNAQVSPPAPKCIIDFPRGGDSHTPWIKRLIPAGWHPFGYKISSLGMEFLKYEGSTDCDVGRFLSSLKTKRKRLSTLKSEWIEIVRVSKTAQSIRIYRTMKELLSFCIAAGFVN